MIVSVPVLVFRLCVPPAYFAPVLGSERESGDVPALGHTGGAIRDRTQTDDVKYQ